MIRPYPSTRVKDRVLSLSWVPLGIVISALSVSALQSKGWDQSWAVSASLWFGLSAVGPGVTAYSISEAKKLHMPLSRIGRISIRSTPSVFGMTASGLLLLVIALCTQLSVAIFPFSGLAQVQSFLIACCFFLNYGALAYLYAHLWFVAVHIAFIQVKANVFFWPRNEINAIYAVYKRLLTIAGIIYLASIGILRFTPWATDWSALNQLWVLCWIVPPAIALLSFFAAMILSLHRVLRGYQQKAEEEIEESLAKRYAEWKNEFDPKIAESITTILKWRDYVRAEKTWPIDLKTAIITITTLLIPSIEASAKFLRMAGQITSPST